MRSIVLSVALIACVAHGGATKKLGELRTQLAIMQAMEPQRFAELKKYVAERRKTQLDPLLKPDIDLDTLRETLEKMHTPQAKL